VPESDAETVRRCLTGDAAAMRLLVERFQSDVFGLCVRMLNDRHNAEDCSQEVFVRVFRSLKRWDATRPLRPWITTITVNRCRTWIAKRMSQPRLAALPEEFAEKQRDEEDGRELAVAVRLAVDGLRDDHKAVFVLFHERGQNYEEISEAVGCPVGTVKTWLHRARAAVLKQLQEMGLVPESDIDHK
jgi:RNA polymerase sigma factor (sigma-70 family)